MSLNEIEQILDDEGFRANPYLDTLDNLTFGHGLTYITPEESEWIVQRRCLANRAALHKNLPWLHTKPQEVENVLVNMAYQLGITGVLGFKKALKCAENDDWEGMASEMQCSKWNLQTNARSERLVKRILALLR